jgi:hypothetical protein
MTFDPQVIVNFEQRITLQVREPFGAKSIVAVSATRRQDEEQAIRQLARRRNRTLSNDTTAPAYG